MENKEFKQLKDEELNEVNGGATTKDSEVRLDEEYKTTIKCTTLTNGAPISENVYRYSPSNVHIIGKDVKSHRTLRDYAAGIPVIGYLFGILFPRDIK